MRCKWAESDELLAAYHDAEWGVPVHDDRHLFEMLNLEGAQAGLSWLTVLRKRANYKRLFDDFDAKKIARYDARRKRALLKDEGIIRNRLKVDAVVANANAFLAVREEFGSFDRYIWSFVGGKPIARSGRRRAIAASEVMSKDLARRGFKFVGATICYAFMQGVGMVDDHDPKCFRAS
jgi:DNA-3-methyladenine glycosylase I